MTYVYIDDPKEIHGLDSSKVRDKQIGESEVARNLMHSVFIFISQMSLVIIVYFYLIKKPDDVDI